MPDSKPSHSDEAPLTAEEIEWQRREDARNRNTQRVFNGCVLAAMTPLLFVALFALVKLVKWMWFL